VRRLLRGRLWRHADFLKLWTGQSVSLLGTQVSILAIPTVAILRLHASAFQVGLLAALEFIAFPVLGLFAGVWVDRLPRRPILVVCDVGRAVAFASIPAGFVFGFLGMAQLYAVALTSSVLSVFFEVAYQSYLPALVERADLVEGNSKLEVTRSLAQVSGPAVAGFLIQAVGGALAVLADAASYIVSVVSLLLIRKQEAAPAATEGRHRFRGELAEGLKLVLGNPVLRRIAGCTATSNLGWNAAFAVVLIFMYRQLHLSPGLVGVVFAAGSIGGVAGAIGAQPLASRLGLGATLTLSSTTGGLPVLLIPLAGPLPPVPLLTALIFVQSASIPVYNINQVSLRQAITPDRLQGRMNATMRTIVWGTIPVGAAVGGWLGTAIGIVPTLLAGGVVGSLAALWIATGPVARLRVQPEPVASPAAPA